MFHVHKPKITIRKAKKSLSNTYKRSAALSKQMSRAVQIDLFKGIKTFQNRIDPAALLDAWKSGNYENIMRIIPWEDLPKDTVDSYGDVLGDLLVGASGFSIPVLSEPQREDLRLDLSNPRIDRYISQRSGEMIVGVQNDTLQIIHNAVARSFNEAKTPDQVADLIRDSIGLTPRYEIALNNYYNQMLSTGIGEEKAGSMAGQYADRLLDARSMAIARTETRNAVNYGQLFVWQDAQAAGYISDNATKIWIVDGDPCEICDPMDGEEVGINESWVLSTGEIVDVPSESHPNCLCGMEINVGSTEEDTADNTPEGDDNEQETEAE